MEELILWLYMYLHNMLEFLTYILKFFQQNNISYMLSGSVAMSTYVMPRATRDFDFIVHLESQDIEAFSAHFSKGYYCDPDSVREAVRNRSMFNVIDHASGFKADFVVLKNESFRRVEFERRVQADFFGINIFIVTAEDLLLSKLIWIQQLQSSIQMEDIKSLTTIEGLDWTYIRTWIKTLNLNTFGLL